MQSAGRRGRLVWLLISAATLFLVGLATYIVWVDTGRPVWGVDDAVIFFVYARNMAAGHGIVYNVGGPHVEGASSFLYLLICWLAWLLFPHPCVALLLFNGLLIVASCLLVWWLCSHMERALALPRYSAIIFFAAFLLWMLANPPFFFWTAVSLMDSEVFSVLLVAAFTILARLVLKQTATARDASLLSFVIVLTVLARPEGMGWGLLDALAFLAIVYPPASARTVSWRLLLLPAAAFVIGLAALIGFRELYFGHALPTTYYAKVTSNHFATLRDGFHYFHMFVRFYRRWLLLPFAIAFCCAAFSLIRRDYMRTFRLTVVAMVFATAGFLVPVAEGGDHFNSFRLYQASFPLFCILPVIAVLPLFRRGKTSLGTTALLVLSLCFVMSTGSTWAAFKRENARILVTAPDINASYPSANRFETFLAATELVNGRQVREMFAPDLPTIGYMAAGGFAYAYDGQVYDLLGLNDERMARADPVKIGLKDHASFNSGVFYLESPEIVLPETVRAPSHVNLQEIYDSSFSPSSFLNLFFKGILSSTRFQSEYRFAYVRSSLHPDLSCYGYFRLDYLKTLLESGKFQLIQFMPTTPRH